MENSAGDWYGKSAEPFGLPSVASHTDGDSSELWVDGMHYLAGGGPLNENSVNSAWDAS